MIIDKERLRAVASPIDVAEHLGMDIQRNGKRVSILCPCHDDKHFGSCYLTDRGFHCYACGERGDIFDMVRAVRGGNMQDALVFLNAVYGGRFEKNGVMKPSLIKKPISREEREWLGLAMDAPVWVTESVISVSEYEEKELNLDSRHRVVFEPFTVEYQDQSWDVLEQPIDPRPSGYYMIQYLVDRNPIQTLLNSDEEAYNELISNKKQEKLDYLKQLRNFKKITELELEVVRNVGVRVWKQFIEGEIAKLEGELSVKRSTNIFGELRGAAL